jgi:hypothetical protein
MWFPHPHPDPLDLEAGKESIRHGGRERFDQAELPTLRDLAHTVGDKAVVDGILDPVGERGVRDFEPDVVEEHLTLAPLLLLDSVPSEDLEALKFDGDHGETAAATVSASTCSRTSCTRKIVAPRS